MKRRLRKKLHVAEFRQFGFEVAVLLAGDPDEKAADDFLDAFILEGIEANRLSCAGGGGPKRWHFIVQPDDRYGGTKSDRDRVAYWLAQRPAVEQFRVGALIDLWHGPDLGDQLEV
jgi:uncharacterized protein YggL (DUF469 family)